MEETNLEVRSEWIHDNLIIFQLDFHTRNKGYNYSLVTEFDRYSRKITMCCQVELVNIFNKNELYIVLEFLSEFLESKFLMHFCAFSILQNMQSAQEQLPNQTEAKFDIFEGDWIYCRREHWKNEEYWFTSKTLPAFSTVRVMERIEDEEPNRYYSSLFIDI